MLKEPSISEIIPFGTPVVCLNEWTNWESKELNSFFHEVSFENILTYRGKSLWLERELSPRHGKVYGYVKVFITKIERRCDDVRVYFHSPKCSGSVSFTESPKKLFDLKDKEEALKAFLQNNPRSTQIDLPSEP